MHDDAQVTDHPEDTLAATVRLAATRIAARTAPHVVFAELAGAGREPSLVALAVCIASGIRREEAEERLAPWTIWWREVDPEDHVMVGQLLDDVGIFDVHRRLTEREQLVADLLRKAISSVAAWPSGYAWGLSRLLRTGRLDEGFCLLTERAPDGAPNVYWRHLCEAGELLATGGGDIAPALGLCRRRASTDRAGPGCPDVQG
jgi:hypothetical protein